MVACVVWYSLQVTTYPFQLVYQGETSPSTHGYTRINYSWSLWFQFGIYLFPKVCEIVFNSS